MHTFKDALFFLPPIKKMKIKYSLSFLFIILISFKSLSQFAIIKDKDGFSQIRESAAVKANIVDSISNGEVVYCFEAEGNWILVEYNFNDKLKNGYIHLSNLKYIEDLTQVIFKDNSVVKIKEDSFNIKLEITPFIPNDHTIEYYDDNRIRKIDGKEFYGTDGSIPNFQYKYFMVQKGNTKLSLPIDQLYEPKLENTTVHYDDKSETIYILASNGEGASGYLVVWILKNGKLKDRIVTIESY